MPQRDDGEFGVPSMPAEQAQRALAARRIPGGAARRARRGRSAGCRLRPLKMTFQEIASQGMTASGEAAVEEALRRHLDGGAVEVRRRASTCPAIITPASASIRPMSDQHRAPPFSPAPSRP